MSKMKLSHLLPILFFTAVPILISACNSSSSGGGSETTEETNTTDETTDDTSDTGGARISGSVTLSSSVAGSNKPSILLQKSAASSIQYKMSATEGVQVLSKPAISSDVTAIPLFAVGDVVSDAFVYLYDAEHPEWLGPVAQDLTDSSGNYEFDAYGCTTRVPSSSCGSQASTNNDAYVDGDSLPQGIYTMLVYKPSTFDPISGVTSDPIVSVMPAFKADSDDIQVEQAEAEVSDVTPNVTSMFGLSKNTNGTKTWGSSSADIPTNAALQITFDVAMSRGSVQNIVVSNGTEVSGSWSLSPDWKTATFKPASVLTTGVHTITVPSTITNVYGNAMGYTATGTFNATAVDSTAPTVTVSPANNTTGVSATVAIRLNSDEGLDVNKLRIDSTPSIGDFPGVVQVKSSGSGYLYEVQMTESLTLGTSYAMTFSGIQDNSGNAASDISLNFTTQAASSADGVDSGANEETQNAQVAISDIFAKWVRAINERNPASISSLMSGSFVFEYSVQAEDGFKDHDVNRNGRLSLKEFMAMMEEGMLHWEFCGTAVTGDIVGNVEASSAESGNFEFILSFSSENQSQDCSDDGGESIYATVKKNNGLWKLTRMSEGFDHRGTPLSSISLIEANLYENDQTADDGLDLIENWEQLDNYADNQTPLTFKFEHVLGVESYTFLLVNEREPSSLGFAFSVSADRLACGDDQQCSAQEGDDLEISVPDPFGNEGLPSGAYPVLELFGFDDERDWGIENPGEIFMWEVIGLGSITAQQIASNNPPTVVELVRDIEAVSAVKRFKNPGEFVDLGVDVDAITSLGGDAQPGGGDDATSPLEYNIYNSGYDAFDADYIHVEVTSPDPNGDILALSGGQEPYFYANSPIGYQDYPAAIQDNGDGTVTLSANMALFNGWTHVEVSNGVNRWEQFQVLTTGGQLPDVELSALEAFDSTPASIANLTLDQWNFVDASSDALSVSEGAVTVDATWSISDGDGLGGSFDINDVIELLTDSTNGGANACNPVSGWANLDIYVHNNQGAYYSVRYCDEQSQAPSGDIVFVGNTISLAADLPVFSGDNWISLNIWGDSGDNSGYYNTNSSFGVFTDAGSVFVPPISLVTMATEQGDLSEIGNWGQGSDWDATDVTTTTDDVTIVVEFAETPTAPMYYAGADGIGSEPVDMTNPDLFTTATQAEFTITLYNGYNWISIEDGNGNWYNLNIFTENGAELPKPKILTANGNAIPEPQDPYAQLQVTVDQCSVTVAGTAPENTEMLYVNWDGGDQQDSYWEGQEIVLPADTNAAQNWSATFQLISGAGSYNNINVYDQTNNSSAWMNVNTTASGCVYSQPVLNVNGLQLTDNTDLVQPVNGGDYAEYGLFNQGDTSLVNPVTDTAVIVYGTTNIPGRSVNINSYLCGSELKVSTQAQATETFAGSGLYAWQLEVPLFDNDDISGNVDFSAVYPFNQSMGISDGWNYTDVTVVSDSGQLPPAPAISLNVPGAVFETSSGCANASWDGINQGASLTELTINGNSANVTDSFGQVYLQDGWLDFAIDSNGDFSVTVPLYDGYNYISFDDMHGGFFSVDIQTANGIYPPQYLFINSYDDGTLSPASLTSATVDVSGAVSIEGDFDNGNANVANFAPDWIYAYVDICDANYNCTSSYYDSDLSVANEYGDLPMSLDQNNGTFSLDVTIPDVNHTVYIDVYGCGIDGCHGHSFTFNDDGYSEDNNYYKPGSGAGGAAFHHRTRQLSR